MIETLKTIVNSQEFIESLSQPDTWKSLDIDYHPPRVERVFRVFGEHRISLHAIHPCTTDEALLHPHPWESAVMVLGGDNVIYEHGIGYRQYTFANDNSGDYIVNNNIISTQQYSGGVVFYEMLKSNSIHYVQPINGIAYSIMLSGPVIWSENNTRVDKELKPLTDERKAQILEKFKHNLK